MKSFIEDGGNRMKQIYALGLAFIVASVSLLSTKVQANQAYQTTKQGLQYKELKAGSGKKPTLNDEVEVRFTSYNDKGEVFEGTFNQVPVILPIREMFSGLQQGLLLMPVGSVYEFNIPAHLGYQEEGSRAKKAALYRIELLRINP
ncbi:TPA: FKBP-type peptidyl-prolyl cis-trans isomerase [Mannheimia haemolytica]|uniref:Peptidyl-prolyl cis-trans isomerase n=2 Tax=Mannheimia haemolytica TaxID=75985 RepID=A0A378NHU1_MANHA|nr:peptidylprolyl isomerase [Mannheimia haemolytica USDA-ARS-USMARC-184]EEY08776.1 peptidylprolyl isomerase, FKBP-type [Mannheimia haemolytica serotype A2 str. OVINE]EEY13009.1 peptidylprolyl isomerase, FKBP-type [Mannheimia haemolytica serotype A2 str. BOVINE]KYL18794.1 peptidylprolyl isomerase [Mannheimia haemolytica]KYL23954.1 peptidylprolyl isomerase [Mannheimia haemolytica]